MKENSPADKNQNYDAQKELIEAEAKKKFASPDKIKDEASEKQKLSSFPILGMETFEVELETTTKEKLRFQSNFLNQIKDAIIALDNEGRVTYLNQAAAERYNINPVEALGSKLTELYQYNWLKPEDEQAAYASLVEKGYWTGENIHIKRDGAKIWVESTVSVLKDESGQNIGMLAVIRDITEHKRRDESLVETNRLLETILDSTHMLVAYLDSQFNFVRVNRAYAEADEREPSFYSGKNHFDLFPNAENEEIFRRVVETGESYFAYARPFEYAEHPERGVTYWDWSLVPVKDLAGTVIGLVLTLLDVTKLKQAEEEVRFANEHLQEQAEELEVQTEELRVQTEELNNQIAERRKVEQALRESEERFLKAFYSSPAALTIARLPEGRWVYVNDSFLHMVEYTREEVIGHTSTELNMFPDANERAQIMRLLLETGSVQNYELNVRTKTGKLLTVLSSNVKTSLDGQEEHVISTILDITERKKVEENLRFLEKSGELIASSLEYETILSNISKLVVPAIADWFSIDIVDEDGSINLVTIHHIDPDKIKWAYELRRAYPLDPNGPIGAPAVIRTGKPEIYPYISDSMLKSIAKNDEELKILRSVGYSSVMIVPLKTSEQTHGCISFVSAESGRHFSDLDLMLATDLARKIATAIENSKLYQYQLQAEEELRRLNEELEERVRKRTEEVLNERQRLYSVLETLPAYVVLLDKDYHIPFANKFFRERFGESGGRRCYEYLFNKDAPCERCETYKVLKTNAPHRWEWTGPDGRNYDIYDYPFVEADGSTIILEMGIDITERKQAHEMLQKSEARLVEAQRMAHIGNWELDIISNTLTWSDEVYRIFELEPQQFGATYEAFLDNVHPDDREMVDKVYTESVKNKTPYEIVHRLLLQDGTIKYVHERCESFYDDDGKPIRSIGTVQDITERNQAEEAKIAAERELEEQRTLRIRSDRLRSLGEMAAGVAHELNQPLVGVRGLAEHTLIGMDRGWELTEEKLRERLRLIVEQADRMSHIIEHVRMFAREAGKPEVTVVQVNDVVCSAMNMLREQFRSRELKLECELSENLPTIIANPFSLEEVIINLIINARDAVEERLNKSDNSSPPLVLLRTSLSPLENFTLLLSEFNRVEFSNGVDNESKEKHVKIEVIDFGIGIPEDILPKVFDPFFTTKESNGGTGLGLSISQSIIEQFGGTIEIKSTLGQGTTVTISLPLDC